MSNETHETTATTAKVPVIDRAAAAIAKAAARDEVRSALSGICIRNGQALATNGFMLMTCDLVHDERAAPAIDPGEVVVPARALADFSRRTKGNSRLTFLESGNDNGISLGYVGAYGTERAELPALTGTFPNTDSIFPADEPTLTIAVDARLLRTILDAMLAAMLAAKQATDTSLTTVFIHTYGDPSRPITLSGQLGDLRSTRRIDALLMPILMSPIDKPLLARKQTAATPPAPKEDENPHE